MKPILDWLIDFFGANELIKIVSSGNYREILTYDGILAVFRPVFPLLLLVELVKALILGSSRPLTIRFLFSLMC